ncbi:MAG: hypothetical protein IJ060_06455 [Oscillospiraceae bacterium]|nr:hypothetical protein [Oscillospiraceae bacterium]
MIVNRSTLTEQDVDFINALIRKQPRIIALRIIAVLLGLLWLFTAGLTGYLQLRYHDRSLSDMMLAAACLIFGVLVLYRTLFLRQTSRRTSMKYKSLFAQRTYTCGENGITAYHAYDGAEFNNRFSYEKIVCFYAREHSVVIRLSGEKKQQIYMCMQDDGYSEGSREELLSLLREKGIAQQ